MIATSTIVAAELLPFSGWGFLALLLGIPAVFMIGLEIGKLCGQMYCSSNASRHLQQSQNNAVRRGPLVSPDGNRLYGGGMSVDRAKFAEGC